MNTWLILTVALLQGTTASEVAFCNLQRILPGHSTRANRMEDAVDCGHSDARSLNQQSDLDRESCDALSTAGKPCEDTRSNPSYKLTGFVDLNSYWDTRDALNTTVNAGANLKNDLQFFQLLNLDSPFGLGTYDWNSFYTELNLRRPIYKDHKLLTHLDWALQYADGSDVGGVMRPGIRWRFHDSPGPVGEFFRDVLKLKYNVTFFVAESDGSGWQMEHTYHRKFLDDRIYLAAFVDHHVNGAADSSDWVTEHQAGIRLFDQWHAVAEYRYKSFAPPALKSGWGIGFQYVMRFK